MDSIIQKLSEIETTACSIVQHAEAQKEMLDKEMEQKTVDFDEKLAADTKSKLDALQKHLDAQMEEQLNLLSAENIHLIQTLQKEYETKHELYAQEILKRITEV